MPKLNTTSSSRLSNFNGKHSIKLQKNKKNEPVAFFTSINPSHSSSLSKNEVHVDLDPHVSTSPSTSTSTSTLQHGKTLTQSMASISNKLSESNLNAMLNEVEILFRTYPKEETIHSLITQLLKSVTQQTLLLDNFVLVHSGFILCIGTLCGMDIVAMWVHHCVRRWHELHCANESGTKEQGFLLILMAFIYNLDGISNQLIFDLFQEMANNFSVSQFDFLLRCIRLTGIKLHKSNPETFKSITSLIHTVATSAYSNSKTPSLKFKFGLEALLELTQNKFRRQSFFQINESPYLTLCIQELKKRGLMKWEPLEPTLSLILNTEAWWTSIPPCTFSSSTHSISTGNDSSMLLQLAKKHHMNSDLRRTIFGILMTSEDYMDAYERFLKLGLKEKQERDIVRVIVQCAGKEKKFNPYYAHLSLKLCEWKHAYKITYQYTLWDFLKTEPSKKQMSAVAHLYGYFVAHQCLSLMAVLKGIDRYQLAHIEFLQDFVQRIELELGPKKALSIEGILEVKELLRQNVG